MYELIHLLGSSSLIACVVSWLLIMTNTFNDIRKTLVIALMGLSSAIVLFVCAHIVIVPELMRRLVSI